MFKKPLFWIILIILAVAGVIFLTDYFPKVMSFVNISISMSRGEALEEAEKLSRDLDLGPAEFESVAIFNSDYYTQIYVELEGGGKAVFNQMLQEDLYKPYRWEVRLFQENETREAKISFTPEGEPYSFREILPETQTGKNVSREVAIILAENFLLNVWNIDLSQFELIEEKSNQVISGRIDHTFVYERKDASINEARYRLRTTVSGDKITELTNYIKIPEAFSRRYAEMRSANNTIATGGQIAMAVFYGFGGILLGIFLLMRKKWLIWKQGVFWAFVVAFLGFISSFNYLPLSWFWYDTAVSKSAFILQNVVQYFTSFLTDFIILALSFIAAESLTRKAFPEHIQFWKVWSRDTAGSNRVLGNTLGGYIVTVFSLCYITVFYFFTTRYLNWWNPSSLLINPNLLATPFPWFSALAVSLHAGFWEEALFRAVPLAGMVLIGQKLNKRKLFLILGLILQALIFGAGHANYAAQPAYARVVELIIPSLLFAFLYLRFGLLTAIILHFVFDAVLISMPVWVSTDKNLIGSKILLVLFFFIPLWVVLYKRIKHNKTGEFDRKNLNENWKPELQRPEVKALDIEVPAKIEFRAAKLLIIFGIIGFIIWGLVSEFTDHTLFLNTNKKEATAAAQKELELQGVVLDEEWEIYAEVLNEVTDIDRYIWQEGGLDQYLQWLGKYIPSSRWRVRFVKFTGDVVERAEEYVFYIGENSQVYSFRQTIPENRAGKELEENEARERALQALEKQFSVNSSEWKEITASPEKLPNRKDWEFVFADTLNYQFQESELRYFAVLSGDKVTTLGRSIHVPEEWLREQKNQKRAAGTLGNFANVLIFLLYFSGFVVALISWIKKKFDLKFFKYSLGFLIAIHLVNLINRWPLVIMKFSSSKPYTNQLLEVILKNSLSIIVISFALAVIGGWIKFWTGKFKTEGKIVLPALAWAGLVAVVAGLLKFASPVWEPVRENISLLGYRVPFLADILLPIKPYITVTFLVFIIFYIVNMVSRNWTRKKIITFFISVILFWLIAMSSFLEKLQAENLIFIFVGGLISAGLFIFIYVKFLKFFPQAIPLITGVAFCLNLLRSAFYNNYSGEFISRISAVIVVAVISISGWKMLKN